MKIGSFGSRLTAGLLGLGGGMLASYGHWARLQEKNKGDTSFKTFLDQTPIVKAFSKKPDTPDSASSGLDKSPAVGAAGPESAPEAAPSPDDPAQPDGGVEITPVEQMDMPESRELYSSDMWEGF